MTDRVHGGLDDYLDAEIRDTLLRRCYPVAIRLGRDQVDELVQASTNLRITVRGQEAPIFEAYRAAHPEAVPWFPTGAGATSAPAVTRRALVHMRAYKRSFGVSHYDGIPIEKVPASCVEVVSVGWPA